MNYVIKMMHFIFQCAYKNDDNDHSSNASLKIRFQKLRTLYHKQIFFVSHKCTNRNSMYTQRRVKTYLRAFVNMIFPSFRSNTRG